MALSFADVRLVAGMLESGWEAELMQTVQECLVAGRGDAGSDSLSPAPRT